MRTALVIRHVAFEDLGAWAAPLGAAGFAVTDVQAGPGAFPQLSPLADDLVIVLGGPIGIYEQDAYPWLREELAFLEQRLRADRPTIGVCLGAQAMAAALGARVYPGAGKEIGFAPITLTQAGRASCLAPFADQPITLHWHGDTFDLPQGATLLASTPLTPHQAFALGPRSLGVQFHPEAGGPGFERWLIGHTLELAQARLAPQSLRAEAERLGPTLERTARAVLNAYLQGAGLVARNAKDREQA